MHRRHELTDEQWALVQPLLPRRTATTGRTPSDPRLMLDGICWILGTGAPWRDLPERFGPWQTVYDHFRKWRKAGVFAAIIEAVQIRLDQQGLIDRDLWCVDGARPRHSCRRRRFHKSCRRHPDEPHDHALGRSRGGFGSKFHLVTDGGGGGTPLTIEVTAGQVHESTRLESVVATFIASRKHRRRKKPRKLAGDKGYGVQRIRDWPKVARDRAGDPAQGQRGGAVGPGGHVGRADLPSTARRRAGASAGSRSAAASARGMKNSPSTSTACCNWR